MAGCRRWRRLLKDQPSWNLQDLTAMPMSDLIRYCQAAGIDISQYLGEDGEVIGDLNSLLEDDDDLDDGDDHDNKDDFDDHDDKDDDNRGTEAIEDDDEHDWLDDSYDSDDDDDNDVPNEHDDEPDDDD